MIAPEFQEILDEYFQSTRELLETAEEALLEMEREEGVPSPERLAELKRTFHTLKGNSAMMGFGTVADLAHLMEDVLAAATRGEVALEEDLVAILLSGMGLVSEVIRSGSIPEETPAEWKPVADELRHAAVAAEAEAATAVPEAGAAPLAAPSEEDLKRRYLGSKTRSLRVDQGKLDTLLELSGEIHVLLTGVADESARVARETPEAAGLSERLERLVKTFGFLQDEIFGVRLVPVGTVFGRFRRLVRDLARTQGKEIAFVVTGEETTLDKAVVDELADPLLHLVRNAVDHGIEPPEERAAKGKPRQATITLAARQTSNLVEIAIVDDGRGLNRAAIRKRAATRGVRTEGLDDAQLLSLVFLPGFSTKEEVTELSGRGVGLDVVRSTLEQFGGSVSVQTLTGRGTEFRLTFPLTLAVAHALLVEVDGEVFAVPMNHLLETFRLQEGTVREIVRHGVLLWRGQLVPVVDGGTLLGGAAGEGRRGYALILGSGGRSKALLVDRPLSNQIIVVKSLDETLGKPFGIAGATLLGSGRIVMILDTRQILDVHVDALPGARGAA